MITINAKTRKSRGKSASRRMRIANKFPGVVYGATEKSIAIELDHDTVFNAQVEKEFYNESINLFIDGKANKVKVKAVQRHPVKPKLTHVDFIFVESI